MRSPSWKLLLAIAIIGRLTVSMTQVSWAHPDEWFQTVELGNYLANGFMSFTEVMPLQYRNLTWPSMLSGVIGLADYLTDHHLGARLWLIRFLTVLLGLSVLWAYRIWILKRVQGATAEFELSAFAVLALPWFTLTDAPRPSQENLAMIALVVALAFFDLRKLFWAGFFAALIGVFKYPALLFTAGIGVALTAQALLGRLSFKSWARFVLGLVLGFILGGLADYLVLGRPYQSLYMYLQYNFFAMTDLHAYGEQGVWAYWPFFAGRWAGFMAPLGIVLAVGAFWGFTRGLKQLEPWALAAVFYLLGHFWVGHKEPRFMIPLEPLLIWAGIVGAREIALRYQAWTWPLGLKRLGLILGVLIAAINTGFFLRASWGETWKKSSTYQEIDRHLRPDTCAVVTVVRPLSVTLPWRTPEQVPEPALAWWPVSVRGANTPETGDFENRPLIWIQKQAQCQSGQHVLYHLNRPDGFWSAAQKCELLPSGILGIFSKKLWPRIIRAGLASGSWYRCPPDTLALFKKVETRKIVGRLMPRYERLPPLGTTYDELRDFARKNSEPGIMDGVMVDY